MGTIKDSTDFIAAPRYKNKGKGLTDKESLYLDIINGLCDSIELNCKNVDFGGCVKFDFNNPPKSGDIVLVRQKKNTNFKVGVFHKVYKSSFYIREFGYNNLYELTEWNKIVSIINLNNHSYLERYYKQIYNKSVDVLPEMVEIFDIMIDEIDSWVTLFIKDYRDYNNIKYPIVKFTGTSVTNKKNIREYIYKVLEESKSECDMKNFKDILIKKRQR